MPCAETRIFYISSKNRKKTKPETKPKPPKSTYFLLSVHTLWKADCNLAIKYAAEQTNFSG